MKKVKNPTLKTTYGREGWHAAITGEKTPLLNLQIVFDFYCKQWQVFEEFEKKLNAELHRYAKQSKKARKKFIFQLDNPILLEELPILWLKLKKAPVYAARFAFYSTEGKLKTLKEFEYLLKSLKSLGLKSLTMPPEVKKILDNIQEE